jgi:hypothetical protein
MRLASALDDGTVWLWDAATGVPLQTLEGHTDWVTSVAFSADGMRLASASYDRTVRLWDAVIGPPLQTLEGHTGLVASVAFSADGMRLASASYDRTVRLWDAVTGAPLQSLQGYTRTVTLSTDNTLLLTDFGQFVVTEAYPSQYQGDALLKPLFRTLQLREEWIQCNENDALWLPQEFRGTCSAVYGKTLVLGQKTGAVSLFRAKDDGYVET